MEDDEDERCAKAILSTLARRAYRRPATEADVQTLLAFYQDGRTEGSEGSQEGSDSEFDSEIGRCGSMELQCVATVLVLEIL